jgi:hypothetical protein
MPPGDSLEDSQGRFRRHMGYSAISPASLLLSKLVIARHPFIYYLIDNRTVPNTTQLGAQLILGTEPARVNADEARIIPTPYFAVAVLHFITAERTKDYRRSRHALARRSIY